MTFNGVVHAGPDWPADRLAHWTMDSRNIEVEPADMPPSPHDPPPRQRIHVCGTPGCRVQLEARGLCDEHRAMIREIAARIEPAKRGPKVSAAATPAPTAPTVERVAIEDGDVFQSDAARVPAEVRALHLARWVRRIGRPVRRIDAAKVTGVRSGGSGPTERVFAVAVERGWIERGPRGVIAPGPVMP